MTQELTQLGKNIKKLRKKYNETQEELSAALGIAHNTLSYYENGRSLPDIEMIKMIAHHYRITVEELTKCECSDMNLSKFSLDKEQIVYILEIIFPIFSSVDALNDENFKKGYDYSLRLLASYRKGDTLMNRMINKCLNFYIESWEKSKTIESVANILSLLSLICFSISDEYHINMSQTMLNDSACGELSSKKYLLRSPINFNEFKSVQELKKAKKEFACENEEAIMECIQTLKADLKWSELGDYYLAMRYLIGMVDTEFDEALNNVIGNELMLSLIQLKNIYAAKCYSSFKDFIK